MTTKQRPLGAVIDELKKVRDQREVLAAKDKELNEQVTMLEEELKTRLLSDGMEKASGKLATISISRTKIASVKDWDAFHAYIKRSGNFHLLQRRVADKAYRELLEAAQEGKIKLKDNAVPGVEPFEKIGLNFRSTL